MTWLRRHAGPLLLIYLVVLAVVLFSPSNGMQGDAVDAVVAGLRRLGVPHAGRYWPWVEFAENVLIIAPVTFFASLMRPRYTWLEWTGAGFLGSLFVETFQAVALPGRAATFSDVVANTLGAMLGAVIALLVLRGR